MVMSVIRGGDSCITSKFLVQFCLIFLISSIITFCSCSILFHRRLIVSLDSLAGADVFVDMSLRDVSHKLC